MAPNCFAIASLDSMVSMAMMRSAPAIAAPCTTFSPTPPQPNTATLEPGSTLRGVEHRADAGGHRAAHQRRAVERDLRVDLDQVVHRQRRVLGHHAAAGEDAERLARLVVHARRALGRRGERLALLHAQHRAPARAEAALAAHVDEGGDDVVADGEAADALAHLDHFARAFVAEHQRRRQRDGAVGGGEVRVAHAAGGELHHHLAALGRVDA